MVRRLSRSIVKAPAAPVPMRAPVPAPVPVPVPAPASASTATMGSLVKDGFAWGLGNGIAHTMVGSIFRPAVVATAVPQVSSEYTQCMKDFEDQAACRHLLPKGYGKE